MTEAQFLTQVKQLAELMGWRVYHTLRSKGSDKGFPDLVMLRDGRQVVAELKVGSNRATAAQLAWLQDFAEVPGVEAHLWTPELWDHITEILNR
jgi:hypothetical protein